MIASNQFNQFSRFYCKLPLHFAVVVVYLPFQNRSCASGGKKIVVVSDHRNEPTVGLGFSTARLHTYLHWSFKSKNKRIAEAKKYCDPKFKDPIEGGRFEGDAKIGDAHKHHNARLVIGDSLALKAIFGLKGDNHCSLARDKESLKTEFDLEEFLDTTKEQYRHYWVGRPEGNIAKEKGRYFYDHI